MRAYMAAIESTAGSSDFFFQAEHLKSCAKHQRLLDVLAPWFCVFKFLVHIFSCSSTTSSDSLVCSRV